MSDTAAAEIDSARKPAPLTRDQIRQKLVGNTPPGRSMLVTFFDVELELRQPNLGDMMEAQAIESTRDRAAEMIINYAYVPGTNEKAFEEGSYETVNCIIKPGGGEMLVDAAVTMLRELGA